MLAPLDMNSHRIINLAPPIDPNDAARLADITGESSTAIGIGSIETFSGNHTTTKAEFFLRVSGPADIDFPSPGDQIGHVWVIKKLNTDVDDPVHLLGLIDGDLDGYYLSNKNSVVAILDNGTSFDVLWSYS